MHASEQDRSDVAAERQAWRDAQPKLDHSSLIFIDESGVTTNMARRYGRAPRGERVIGSVPHGHWMTSTFIAGLRHDGIIAPCLFNCAIDGELFLAYVEQQLAPSLAPGDIVIADNLSSHKVTGVREAIEARGALLWFLPSYSPDLNPIEHAFAKLKELLRAEAPRTIEALWDTVGRLLNRFTPAECANYFAHDGYRRSG